MFKYDQLHIFYLLIMKQYNLLYYDVMYHIIMINKEAAVYLFTYIVRCMFNWRYTLFIYHGDLLTIALLHGRSSGGDNLA
jgi:hypothetical protein